jgi:AcrR family transcriptional regulator
VKHRAHPLAAEDRRRAILAAVVPLLTRKGSAVTTAEMAQAAGVAEGTIFKVFPDKAALICAAVTATIDPTSACEAMQQIPVSVGIERQFAAATEILRDRFERVTALGEVLRALPDPGEGRLADARRYVLDSHTAVSSALSRVIDRHRTALRVDPDQAAAALVGLVFASVQSLTPPTDRLSVDDVVAILLRGISQEKEP